MRNLLDESITKLEEYINRFPIEQTVTKLFDSIYHRYDNNKYLVNEEIENFQENVEELKNYYLLDTIVRKDYQWKVHFDAHNYKHIRNLYLSYRQKLRKYKDSKREVKKNLDYLSDTSIKQAQLKKSLLNYLTYMDNKVESYTSQLEYIEKRLNTLTLNPEKEIKDLLFMYLKFFMKYYIKVLEKAYKELFSSKIYVKPHKDMNFYFLQTIRHSPQEDIIKQYIYFFKNVFEYEVVIEKDGLQYTMLKTNKGFWDYFETKTEYDLFIENNPDFVVTQQVVTTGIRMYNTDVWSKKELENYISHFTDVLETYPRELYEAYENVIKNLTKEEDKTGESEYLRELANKFNLSLVEKDFDDSYNLYLFNTKKQKKIISGFTSDNLSIVYP